MTTVLVRRPAALDLARPDPGDPLVVAAPPQQAEHPAGPPNLAMIVMPLVSGSGSLLIALTNQDRPLFAATGLVFMLASVGLGIVLFVGTRSSVRRRARTDRERYLDYLEQVRRTAKDAAERQQHRAAHRHPASDELLDLARLPARRWERRTSDADFLSVRVGLGTTPLSRVLEVHLDGSNPLISYEPVCLTAAQGLVRRYATLSDQPIAAALAEVGHLSVVGERERTRALARSIICQIAALHAPDDVRIAVVRAGVLEARWDWVKWLPHSINETSAMGSSVAGRGSRTGRLVAGSVAELLDVLGEDMDARRTDAERRRGPTPANARPRLVIVVDGEFQLAPPQLGAAPGSSLADLGVHVIGLIAHRREEPEQVDLRITLQTKGHQVTDRRGGVAAPADPDAPADAMISRTGSDGAERVASPVDGIDISSARALARALAPLRLAAEDGSATLTSTIGLREILSVPDVAELDPRRSWLPGTARDFLRVPVGIGATGGVVSLDLKESARGGMGPHGLVVGATGSGKSELLRTMVTSLVIGHSPERLALLLVDFKGGATFAGLACLPHIAGMVTNLAEDPGLVQRFRDALYGELTRRQRALAEAGNLPNLQAYAELVGRTADAGLEPMPHLLVIIDEFTELLTARPDFAELFLAVGRIGRSIGVHLLLATQRLDAGKVRGLDSHLSYRISLRTFSEAESREALGVPDAYHLPAEPGSGYLKVDTSVFERFKSAMVSAPYQRPVAGPRPLDPITPFTTCGEVTAGRAALDPVSTPGTATSTPGAAEAGAPAVPTVLDVAVRRLADAGAKPVRPVWIAPLPPALSLDALAASDPSPGEPRGVPSTVITVVGLQDIPAEQRQMPLTWDFTGAQGNLLVLGRALSGKSVLLRTMVCSLALRYPPGQLAFYCLDYGGGSLSALEKLPHVAGVSSRSDVDRVRRTVADVVGMLESRERLMSRHGCEGIEGLRRARRDGVLPSDVPGDVFLVIDGWAALREAEPDLEDPVMAIANRGPSLGVHTIVSATAGSQVRMRLAASLPGRIELRLPDAFESAIDRQLAAALPADTPGRALVPGGYLAQVALPRIDGRTTTDDLAAGVESLIGAIGRRWPRGGVGRVRVLPPMLDLTSVQAMGEVRPGDGGGVIVGVSERDLAPVAVDVFGADPHLQVYGESQSGKSAFLRTLLRQLMRARSPADLGIVLIDYRRAHLDLVPRDYLLAYCTGAAAAHQAMAEVSHGLLDRLPGPEVTGAQLRARNWWSGRDLVVVADDYDLVAAAGNPLATLSEFLPQGRDVGLHVITARRTGGASRAMFETVTQALTDLGGPGVLFSGDRTEGRLVAGVASVRLPTGRALLARRGVPAEQVQIAWSAPA